MERLGYQRVIALENVIKNVNQYISNDTSITFNYANKTIEIAKLQKAKYSKVILSFDEVKYMNELLEVEE